MRGGSFIVRINECFAHFTLFTSAHSLLEARLVARFASFSHLFVSAPRPCAFTSLHFTSPHTVLLRYINGSVHDHESWNGKVCGANYTDKDCEMGQWTGPTWPASNCGGGVGPQVTTPPPPPHTHTHTLSYTSRHTHAPTHLLTHPPTHPPTQTRTHLNIATPNTNRRPDHLHAHHQPDT
jgi:hypothetical protein